MEIKKPFFTLFVWLLQFWIVYISFFKVFQDLVQMSNCLWKLHYNQQLENITDMYPWKRVIILIFCILTGSYTLTCSIPKKTLQRSNYIILFLQIKATCPEPAHSAWFQSLLSYHCYAICSVNWEGWWITAEMFDNLAVSSALWKEVC